MANNKDTFVFRKDWWDAIKELPKNVRGEVCEGIVRYAFGETEAGLGNMAQMAMRFIMPQIDRDREKYEMKCEQNRANASGRKQSQANANERKRSQANRANAVYDNDSDNDYDNSLSLSPSHEVENAECGEDIGGVSAAEKESFFEILFFKNFKNPEKETDRLIDHYSAVGWRRHGDIRAVKDKTALARNWKPQSENDIGRFSPDILQKLQAAYAEIKGGSPDDARTIIRETYRIEDGGLDFRIVCSMAAMEAYNRHWQIFNKINLTNGKQGRYSIPKK